MAGQGWCVPDKLMDMRPKVSFTLPGNPRGFTIKQHVFPRSAIARFAAADGKVEVQSVRATWPKRKFPTADIFCAKRAWDQSTETWRTRSYETEFQSVANELADGRTSPLSCKENQIVSEFFSLWMARHHARKESTGDVLLNGVFSSPITDEEAEILEAKGYAFTRGNVMPSHIFTSMRMKLWMDRSSQQLHGVRWGILRAGYGEFIVPDNSDGFATVPVTPKICLVAGAADSEVSPLDVARINFIAVQTAHEYYFARDLDYCPILRRTIPRQIDLRGILR